MSMEMKLQFRFSDETKGAVKYREVLHGGTLAEYPNTPGATVGILYIRKKALEQLSIIEWPRSVTLTIEGES